MEDRLSARMDLDVSESEGVAHRGLIKCTLVSEMSQSKSQILTTAVWTKYMYPPTRYGVL